MKKWGFFVGLVAIVFAAAYVGSPYLAARHFRQAALSADADQLDESVDFPAVRDSLKSQLSAMMMRKLQNDPDMKNNPFAGLGMMLAPALIDKAVDAYITPDGISAMVKGNHPGDTSAPTQNPDIRASHQWVSLDRFRVKLRNVKTRQDGPSLLFERRGLFSWKLIKLELPPDLPDGSANAPSADGGPGTADRP